MTTVDVFEYAKMTSPGTTVTVSVVALPNPVRLRIAVPFLNNWRFDDPDTFSVTNNVPAKSAFHKKLDPV